MPDSIRTRFVVVFYAAVTALASVACLSVGACASAGGSSGVAEAGAPHRDRSVITYDDMKDLQLSNLFDVVQRLHPEWLIQRNAAGMGQRTSRSSGGNDTDVAVYFDSQRAGTVDMLKQMPITPANSLKYYSASEAQARFGNGNLNGVIQVVTVSR